MLGGVTTFILDPNSLMKFERFVLVVILGLPILTTDSGYDDINGCRGFKESLSVFRMLSVVLPLILATEKVCVFTNS